MILINVTSKIWGDIGDRNCLFGFSFRNDYERECVKMLYSEIFKNYYPVKDVSVLWNMSQAERKKLCRWMSTISKEVALHNTLLAKRQGKKGFRGFYGCVITYDRQISLLVEKLCQISSSVSDIDDYDIDFINDVIYNHKYSIELLRDVVFPIRNKKREVNIY